MTQRHQPCAPIQRHTKPIAVTRLGLTGINPDTNHQVTLEEGSLHVNRRVNGRTR